MAALRSVPFVSILKRELLFSPAGRLNVMASPSRSLALNSPMKVPTGWFSVSVSAVVEFRSMGAELASCGPQLCPQFSLLEKDA